MGGQRAERVHGHRAEGRVCALVGPNGAGKTTLLRMFAGLAARPAARLAFWGAPRPAPAFTAEDHIRIVEHLNPRWDASLVRTRLAELRTPVDQRGARCPAASAPR